MRFPRRAEPDGWLRERVHLEHPGSTLDGRFVLYWMATALRARDNPCLDAALRTAARRSLPLVVYQGLTHRAWYASDRTHAFVLQGAVDVAAALDARGIRHVLHLERTPGDRGSTQGGLAALARDAAMVFTEDFPVGDLPRWRASLARATGRPVYVVDTACVLPMRVAGSAWERAFAFRDATHASRMARLDIPEAPPVTGVSAWEGALPWAPVDTARMDIGATVAGFQIDHAVAPVPWLRGGTRAAEAHWTAWRDEHLATYHQRRTDASDPTGASQMSAWLHFGMIAPWRVAAEARAVGGPGAEKFLDELLTWRELAWCFCAHRTDHGAVTALPAWARETLAATRDRRTQRPTLDAMERGHTGDGLYDLAQRSLVRHGVLHNNTRMTWGRTLAGWFADPAEGLQQITALNHRYALDGRDPASYGGILWCYGQFDRPQPDRGGVLGAVPTRAGDAHLQRLDAPRYARWIHRDRGVRCVVVGAGLAGLMAARVLRDHGATVTVLDKAAAPGGRMATRRTDAGVFDHGAQFFTARDPWFRREVTRWVDAGAATPWFAETWRGTQGMASVSRHLAAGTEVVGSTRVTAIRGASTDGTHGWTVHADDGRVWQADAVIVTPPVPQSLAMVEAGGVVLDPTLRAGLLAMGYARCLAGMFVAPWGADLPAHGVVHTEGPVLAWLASNRAKGITAHDAVTAHAGPTWSLDHWDQDDATVLAAMGTAVAAGLGCPVAAVQPVGLKRWRYARPERWMDTVAVHRADHAVLVWAGDAFARDGGRVEAAVLSGVDAAAMVLREAVGAVGGTRQTNGAGTGGIVGG